VFTKTKKWASRTLKELERGTTEKDLLDLAGAARDLRRSIQEGAHLKEKEIEAVTLKHDDRFDIKSPVVVTHA
jgi:hypothetical protein